MAHDDRSKLEILLGHWIDHNREHAGEFSGWASKAKEFGKAIVHDEILEAVQHMNGANESLHKALQELKK